MPVRPPRRIHAVPATLTPVLRPFFRANHNWAMKRGQERILTYLDEA
jgi:hypothetical protein